MIDPERKKIDESTENVPQMVCDMLDKYIANNYEKDRFLAYTDLEKYQIVINDLISASISWKTRFGSRGSIYDLQSEMDKMNQDMRDMCYNYRRETSWIS